MGTNPLSAVTFFCGRVVVKFVCSQFSSLCVHDVLLLDFFISWANGWISFGGGRLIWME